MLKKSLIILSIFCAILFLSNMCFAEGFMQGAENVLDRAGEGARDMAESARDAAGRAGEGARNMVDDLRDGAENAGDAVRDGAEGITDMGTDMTSDMEGTDDYTATRTSATGTNTSADTTFVWIILAIAALLIVGLVWYYGAQTKSRNNH